MNTTSIATNCKVCLNKSNHLVIAMDGLMLVSMDKMSNIDGKIPVKEICNTLFFKVE